MAVRLLLLEADTVSVLYFAEMSARREPLQAPAAQ
jgi:hypothetical protein